MNNHWLEQAKKRLQEEANQGSDIPFERLRGQGLINDRGEVTGHLRRWNADLAITEIKRGAGSMFEVFRCLKPVFGMPGGATIDVSRESLVAYLKDGKRIITALRDDRLDMWMEGCDVHLSARGFVQCGSADDTGDNLGSLPEFHHSNSRL